MFCKATSANPDTSSWDVSKVYSMEAMFCDARIANPDTSNWRTSSLHYNKWIFDDSAYTGKPL